MANIASGEIKFCGEAQNVNLLFAGMLATYNGTSKDELEPFGVSEERAKVVAYPFAEKFLAFSDIHQIKKTKNISVIDAYIEAGWSLSTAFGSLSSVYSSGENVSHPTELLKWTILALLRERIMAGKDTEKNSNLWEQVVNINVTKTEKRKDSPNLSYEVEISQEKFEEIIGDILENKDIVKEAKEFINNNLENNQNKNYSLATYCKAFGVSYKFNGYELGCDFVEASRFDVSLNGGFEIKEKCVSFSELIEEKLSEMGDDEKNTKYSVIYENKSDESAKKEETYGEIKEYYKQKKISLCEEEFIGDFLYDLGWWHDSE